MILMDRHDNGYTEDLQALDNDISDIYMITMDVKTQHDVICVTPVDFRGDLIRTINYSMWFVNASLTRVIKGLRDIEDYVAVNLTDAYVLDEDDPLLSARKVKFLCQAYKLAGVIAAYGQVVTRHRHPDRTSGPMKDMQFVYDKLTYILQHYHVFDGEGVLKDDDGGIDEDDVDEEHRPELAAAKEAVAAAKIDKRRLIVDECLTEMAEIAAKNTIVYTADGYLKKWKSRAMSVGRYFLNLFRWFRRLY